MPLRDDLQDLRDRAIAELDAVEDYYADTKLAWQIVQSAIADGLKFVTQNLTTGTTVDQIEMAGRARGYVAEQLAEATFQQFVSVFESYFSDLLRMWLMAYPQGLSKKEVPFEWVLDAPDKDTIMQRIVAREVLDVFYDRPTKWFEYLERRVKIGCPRVDEIERLTEAKATRDVLVHSRGIANALYHQKSGQLARYGIGERIEIPKQYHSETWQLLRKLVEDITNATMAKVI